MEDKIPVGHIKRLKPPAEPPPSLEIKPDEHQWIDDTVTTATSWLKHETTSKIVHLNDSKYEPIRSAQINHKDTQEYLTQQKIYSHSDKKGNCLYRTRYPQQQLLNIPTPKTKSTQQNKMFTNIYDTTSYGDNESVHWEKCNNKWMERINKAQDMPDFETSIANKWDKLVGKTTQDTASIM